ncbi:hypothetical protein BJ912DRAFT_1002906, partial [Pholiota molesta]
HVPVASIDIPADVVYLIASFIPSHSAPPTLRALALGNRHLHDIVLPLLYSRLVLRTEHAALTVFQRILRDPYLGRAVTQLHVMSNLSDAARGGATPFDVLGGIQLLVAKRLVPRLSALGIHLMGGDEEPIIVPGRLRAEFWGNLRDACPRLRALVLRNVGYGSHDLWLSGTAIDAFNSISGLSTLRLEWRADLDGLSAQDGARIYKHLPHLAPSLHTLSLAAEHQDDYQDASLVLRHAFPHLKRLSLQRFRSDDADYAIAEAVEDPGFLPNLRHLKARFDDIRALLPVLPRLASLSFTESYNCQVPYLLRALLPAGLPALRSLEIAQAVGDTTMPFLEGVRWSETEEGWFHVEKSKYQMARTFVEGYMHSIVRGAPGLQELGLHGMVLTAASLDLLARDLSQLHGMKRFYYRGFALDPLPTRPASEDADSEDSADYTDTDTEDDPGPEDEKEEALTAAGFLASAAALARVCGRLECVTSLGGRCLPYVAAAVGRGAAGEVTGVRRCEGVGMLIPAYEDDPFPCNT